MDSKTEAPYDDEILRTVVSQWGTVCASGVPQTMTLKADDSAPVTSGGSYVVKERLLGEGGSAEAEPVEYELGEILGEGGMGVVYNARQTSMNRSVAVKMLKANEAGNNEREKFLAEAAVTADLDHPNIVPIYDLGSHGSGTLFYSMKRVQGTPWEETVDQLSNAENLAILLRVADAVAFAHARGFIHRDLKPENIMLGEFGEVLVMDWGLAIPTAQNAKWRVHGSAPLAGTPAYMAPEMAQGDASRLGCASDIYLLGGILYRILTGKPPHAGDTVMQCVLGAAKNEIAPTEQRGELMEIALRALATDTADRFSDVHSFQDAILQYQAHSESIQLTERAERELAEAETTGEYRTFARAVFRLEEACTLWSGNDKAQSGLAQARLAYARTALRKGDLDLAGSLLDEETAWPARSHTDLEAVRRELASRRTRLKRQKLALGLLCAALGLLLILGMSITLWLRGNALELARQQGPAARQSARSLAGVQRSLAALRGWMALGNESFKTERQGAWDDEILPA